MRVWAVISAPIFVSKGVGVSKSTGFGYYLLQTTGRIQRGYGGRGGWKLRMWTHFCIILWDVIYLFPTMYMGVRGGRRVRIYLGDI